MSPVTQGAVGRWTSGLRMVSRNPGHFRRGRWVLLAEGVLLIVLSTAGFISAATHSDRPPGGAPVLILALTPWHSAILLGFGVLATMGTRQRHAAIVVTALGAVGFVVLVFVGAVAATHHTPGVLGFEARDVVLHGVLAAANFAILYWLIPDVLEGPDWVPRPGTRIRHGHNADVAPTSSSATVGVDIAPVPTAESPPADLTTPDSPKENPVITGPRDVVITGASAGYGRAVARESDAGGDTIALLTRSAQQWLSRHARSTSMVAAALASAAIATRLARK